jgi:hypothetical protein
MLRISPDIVLVCRCLDNIPTGIINFIKTNAISIEFTPLELEWSIKIERERS